MLTAKQEAFCQAIVEGKTQYEAYTTVYNTKTQDRNTVDSNASQLLSDTKVAQRVKELRQEIEKQTIKEIVYNREIAFKTFDDNILLLKKSLEEIELDTEMSLKDKAYLKATLTKNIQGQEEQKAKLWSLYVEKKDINVGLKSFEDLIKDLD